MSQFVQKGRPHFLAKNFLIPLGKIPKIFQKQNNLRRQGNIPFVGKFRPGEQTQRVRLNPIGLQIRIRLALKRYRQFFRPLPQRLRQRRQRRLNFRRTPTAHNFSQFKFTAQIWRGRRPLATASTDFFLALERRRFMVV